MHNVKPKMPRAKNTRLDERRRAELGLEELIHRYPEVQGSRKNLDRIFSVLEEGLRDARGRKEEVRELGSSMWDRSAPNHRKRLRPVSS